MSLTPEIQWCYVEARQMSLGDAVSNKTVALLERISE